MWKFFFIYFKKISIFLNKHSTTVRTKCPYNTAFLNYNVKDAIMYNGSISLKFIKLITWIQNMQGKRHILNAYYTAR